MIFAIDPDVVTRGHYYSSPPFATCFCISVFNNIHFLSQTFVLCNDDSCFCPSATVVGPQWTSCLASADSICQTEFFAPSQCSNECAPRFEPLRMSTLADSLASMLSGFDTILNAKSSTSNADVAGTFNYCWRCTHPYETLDIYRQ